MPKSVRIKPIRPAFPALEWLDEASGQLPRILLAGGRRAMIENHSGLLEFTDESIRLMTREGVLTIAGRGLLLSEVRPDALTVRGEIAEIRLPTPKGGA